MTDEGLIEPEPSPSGAARRVALGVTAVFLLALATTLVTDLVWPAPPRALVGQEAVDAARARESRAVLDGSAARWIEEELERRSRTRRALAPWWAAFLVKYARAGTTDAVVGEGDWLFLRQRVTPPAAPTGSLTAPGIHALAAAARRLAATGSELVLMPIPRKAVVCRDRLPEGLDPRPELDRHVLDELARRGVAVVDLLAAWRGMPSDALYLPQDSHWALDGQIAAARACVSARPELQGKEFEGGFERVVGVPRGGNLDFAGVPPEHAAHRWLARPGEASAALHPSVAARYQSAKRMPSDVALVGTSFSANYDFPALVFSFARRDLFVAGYAGAPLVEPLARLRVAVGTHRQPRTVLYEFPMNQIWDLQVGLPGATNAVIELFARAPLPSASRLDAGPGTLLWMPEGHSGGLRVVHVDGGLVTTGEGLACLRVESDHAEGTMWRFDSVGFASVFEWPRGARVLDLPLIEAHLPSGQFSLQGRDPRALVVPLTCSVVTDLDLSRAVAPTPYRTFRPGAARFGFAGHELLPRAALVLQLGGEHAANAPLSVTLIAPGRDPRTHEFRGPRGGGVRGGTLALIALGDFAGAAELRVDVHTTLPVTALTLAPPIGR